MTANGHGWDWRGVIRTLVAFGLAWLAWTYAPFLLAMLGLDDLDLLGRIIAVVLMLNATEFLFARLPDPL